MCQRLDALRCGSVCSHGQGGDDVSPAARLLVPGSLSLGLSWTGRAGNQRVQRPALEVGQRFIYSVSFSHLRVGSAELTLSGRDTLGGHSVWNAALHISAGFGLFGVDDHMWSWFDPTTFASRRLVRKLGEGRYRPDPEFRINPERRVYSNKGEPDVPSVSLPLDEVSFLYFVRTLKLEPGAVLTFDRYFRPEGNPVTIRVIGRERKSTRLNQSPDHLVCRLLLEKKQPPLSSFSRMHTTHLAE